MTGLLYLMTSIPVMRKQPEFARGFVSGALRGKSAAL